ncbi:hypothetical protein [Streptomyces sp. NPDC007264]|uniref:hypothetical protein n=1 Tax=Streptomyces sp. NPDC007264 TaxID=3364777 RepID=UPI0036DC9CC0
MDHNGGGGTTVWEFDTEQVKQIWRDTREVFGNKLWIEGMLYNVFYEEWQREAEERSGTDFFDLLVSTVAGQDPGDPSEVFAAFRRGFAQYGITTVFAPHPDHGDVLERARRIEAGESLPEPGPWHLDESYVTEVWDDLAEDLTDGGQAMADSFPEQLLDAFELATRDSAFCAIERMLDDLAEGDDPSQAFAGLRELAAAHGIELTFAPHPRWGDLIERAKRLRTGEPVQGSGP